VKLDVRSRQIVAAPINDERSERETTGPSRLATSVLQALAVHREISVLIVLVGTFAVFAIEAHGNGFLSTLAAGNYLEIAAIIGIVGGPIALLMTAHEFDLSVGSMMGLSEVIIAWAIIGMGWSILEALALALAVGVVVGVINARLVVKTGLSSFIITLAGLFVLQGVAEGLGLAKLGSTTIGNVVAPVSSDPLLPLFSSRFFGFLPVSVLWWAGVVVVTAWVLHRTPFGNWISAVGGDVESARKRGVPVLRVKTILYIATATMAVLVGCLTVFTVNYANADDGANLVFEVVTVSVIGGTLITGGRGSPIGTAIASLLFGIINQGFYFTGISQSWYNLFVGILLLGAVLINRYTEQLIESGHSRIIRRRA
jgi:simple sugar transport system permease protein